MLFTCYTNLKPESISHIEGLESDHHGEGWREGASTLVRLSQEHQVNHQPTNQTGPQLTEKLQVKATNPWIQLVANEEIVQDISCRKNRLLNVWKNCSLSVHGCQIHNIYSKFSQQQLQGVY